MHQINHIVHILLVLARKSLSPPQPCYHIFLMITTRLCIVSFLYCGSLEYHYHFCLLMMYPMNALLPILTCSSLPSNTQHRICDGFPRQRRNYSKSKTIHHKSTNVRQILLFSFYRLKKSWSMMVTMDLNYVYFFLWIWLNIPHSLDRNIWDVMHTNRQMHCSTSHWVWLQDE